MLVNSEIIRELYDDAGTERIEKAKLYARTGKVTIEKINYEDKNNFDIIGKVTGQDIYRTHISVEGGEITDVTCECPDYQNRYAACKHIVATMMEFSEKSEYENMLVANNDINNKSLRIDSKYRSFKQIVNEFYSEQMQETEAEKTDEQREKIKIEPKFIYDKYTNTLRVEFRIGNQRMYKIKNLQEFYCRMRDDEKYKYGNKLEFFHKKENFVESDQELLEFILKQSEIINFVNSNANSNYRYYGKAIDEGYILLSNSGIDEIFEILKGREIILQNGYLESRVELKDENPDLHFVMQKKRKK